MLVAGEDGLDGILAKERMKGIPILKRRVAADGIRIDRWRGKKFRMAEDEDRTRALVSFEVLLQPVQLLAGNRVLSANDGRIERDEMEIREVERAVEISEALFEFFLRRAVAARLALPAMDLMVAGSIEKGNARLRNERFES